MIIYDVQQGSQKWLELRAGIPTASQFDKIITPSGASSKQASDYCNKLLCEVILGRPLAGTSMPWMERGKEMEAEAVKYYEFQRDVETIPIGFITTDDGRVGASPDRLVGDHGLLEIKCPTDETHSKYLAAHIDALLGQNEGVADAYKVQVQGQLYVAEREWSDIQSYFPGLPEAITRVHRDEPFILRMKSLLEQFLEMFDERFDKLQRLGYITSGSKKEPEDDGLSVFGLTEQDVEDYIASLKKETPAGDSVASERAAESTDAPGPSGGGEPPQQSLFAMPEPAYADPGDVRRGRKR